MRKLSDCLRTGDPPRNYFEAFQWSLRAEAYPAYDSISEYIIHKVKDWFKRLLDWSFESIGESAGPGAGDVCRAKQRGQGQKCHAGRELSGMAKSAGGSARVSPDTPFRRQMTDL